MGYIVSLNTLKQMIFRKTLQKMLKQDLRLQILNQTEHCLREKIKKNGLMKHELGGKIMKKVVGLRAKTQSYLIDEGSEDKQAKDTKKVCHKIKT